MSTTKFELVIRWHYFDEGSDERVRRVSRYPYQWSPSNGEIVRVVRGLWESLKSRPVESVSIDTVGVVESIMTPVDCVRTDEFFFSPETV